ncbi:DegT/DnrJ/EryC1/StrS family aminotransferase [Roseococcus sp. SYP-B2431]|uniref:DegT/DnrJ/EryC1/StrS family aminotransferase n=1 Tax=Roseococcus sp. SYP-B2431 TaxID=2496640 RepID=UPI001039AA3A|nr:DegT/DnrJ/EryC1/StrS family aminotransferase [Roseococcus sp. SYP-B2431]TCH96612.1 DegT/DnrJ/EryC1/StrS family aminotransferase [Roseococcus sp. SYP-B2431]
MNDQTRPIALFDMQAQQALIRPELDRRIAHVLSSGRFINGPEVAELEKRLADFAGCGHAVGVSSGTDALQIAMMAEGIGRGDAVFLPAFTYTATAEVPLVLGATPVFVDVDPDTFNIDLADLERRIGLVLKEGRLKPRAIVGVDLFGLPADWPALNALAQKHGMVTLDDAAQAFGATLHGKALGRHADVTTLSFYPTKTLGCYGDGGAMLTESAEKAELYRSLRTHGEGGGRYEVLRTGMNGRLDTLQAAILLCKMDLFAQELQDRAKVASWYAARLTGKVALQRISNEAQSAWGLYTIRLADAEQRARVQASLKSEGIPFGVYYPKPLHHQPAYRAAHAAGLAAAPALAVSEALCHQVMSLPMHPYLTEGEVDRVAEAVVGAL